jgi:hypothetical protein
MQILFANSLTSRIFIFLLVVCGKIYFLRRRAVDYISSNFITKRLKKITADFVTCKCMRITDTQHVKLVMLVINYKITLSHVATCITNLAVKISYLSGDWMLYMLQFCSVRYDLPTLHFCDSDVKIFSVAQVRQTSRSNERNTPK